MTQRTIRTLRATALPILALLALNACNSTSTSVQVSKPPISIGQSISKDTLHGPLKGTMLAGKTYYMDSDIIVNAGDTLFAQEGVTLIALGKTSYYPEIQLYGTFISMGTADRPNYLTVLPALRTYANLQAGLWGGIQCDPSSGDLILMFTHIEFIGGAGNAVGVGKKVAYGIYFQNPNANFIMEDSWLTGGTDDPVRTAGAKVSILRNVFEAGSTTSGDGFNMKTGTTGDVAYNVFIGNCTNGPKVAMGKSVVTQPNVNIYNNTIVTCGWRMTQTGRAGSTNIEDQSRGTEYNNLIVNCRTGFRLVDNPLADTAHVYYDYQWYYGLTDSVRLWFYPGYKAGGFIDDGVSCEVPKPHDHAGATGANDPMFVGYDVTAIAATRYVWPTAWADQDPRENVVTTADGRGNRFSDLATSFKSDFHLKSGSPCIGTAYSGTSPQPAPPVPIPMMACPQKSAANPFGATTTGLGKDFGAYQTDGSGNAQ